MEKINVWGIVREHFATLRSFRQDKPLYGDFLLFFGLPLIAAGIFLASDSTLSGAARGLLATGLSIFAGLLFNLLLLVADIAIRDDQAVREGPARFRARIKTSVLRELHSNIAFAVLLSLATLVCVILLSVDGSLPGRGVLEAATIFLGTLFVLTLLMILKRAHMLIADEVQEAERITSSQPSKTA